MKKVTSALLGLLVAGAFSGAAVAADQDAAMQVHNTKGCIGCHAVSNQMVGPSYKAIGAKHEVTEENIQKLVQSVRQGSSGKYGRMAMPPHAHVSEADVRTIVEWIVTLE